MLYDLNIAWSPTTTPSQLDRTLSFASHLGYSVIALNHTLTHPIPSSIPNPLPKFPPPDSSSSSPPTTRPTVLHRATIPISDPSTNHRLPSVTAAYDLVALRPTTERAFAAACLSLSDFSLISLDLTQFFDFYFPPRTCMAAVSRGIRFEICYAQCLSSREARSRSNFLANTAGLLRATKGRGIVVSSEASGSLGLRAPADVVNLLAVWGLGTERGRMAMEALPRGVVVNEGLRRRGFRGVVDVISGAGGGRESGDETGLGKKEKGKGKGKGAQQQGQKRRSEEEEDTPGEGDPPVSKRQAKKMRMAIKQGRASTGS